SPRLATSLRPSNDPLSDDGTPAASRHPGHRRGGHLPLLRKPRPRRLCVVRRRPPHGVRLPSVPSAGLGGRLLVPVPHVLARYTFQYEIPPQSLSALSVCYRCIRQHHYTGFSPAASGGA